MIKLNKLGILCMTLVLLIMFTNKASATSDISPASLNYFVEKLDIEVFKQEKDYYCAVFQTRSELVLQIKYGGKIIGLCNSESEETNYYTKEMVEQLYKILEKCEKF